MNRHTQAHLLRLASELLGLIADDVGAPSVKPSCGPGCAEQHTYGVDCLLAGMHDQADVAPELPPAARYEMTAPPTIETLLRDRLGSVWAVDRAATGDPFVVLRSVGPEDDPFTAVGDQLAWHAFLGTRGPATAEVQDEWDRETYGPWGGRWAAIGTYCATRGCVLWANHSSRHRDDDGNDPSSPQENLGPSSVTPAEAAEVLCTCGTPANHQPGCPRYDRLHGTETGARDELPF